MEVGGWRRAELHAKHHHRRSFGILAQNLTKLQTPHQSKNEREIQFTIVTDSLGSEPTQTAGREGQKRRILNCVFEFVVLDLGWTDIQ